jgi:hypothetical protein
LNLDANGDNNEVDVDGVASGSTTNVDGRAGNDDFDIGDFDYDSNIIGTLAVDGGGGTGDNIQFFDALDVGNDSYTFSDETATFGTALFKGAGGTTLFSAVEQVELQANDDNNTITVNGTQAGTELTLYGLDGNDDFIVGGLGDLDLVDDALTIWAGFGTDNITFDDSLDQALVLGDFPRNYRITDSTVTKIQQAPLFEQDFEYLDAEELVLEANSHGSSITVYSTAAGSSVTLNGNDGNDKFNIGEDNNVSGIDGQILADGGAGTDELNYNDSAATQDRTYTVSPTEISRTNVATIDPSVEEVVVNAGLGNDTINVTANTPTTVNGGGGNDTINAAGGNWDLQMIAQVAVDGGAGTDHLLIDDQNDGGADDYDLDATTADKSTPFSRPITFTTIESLELAANTDANDITVNSTFDGDVEVRGRGGADQFMIVETFAGRSVTVEDGPDLDQVSVNANGVGSASVVFDSSQDLASLTIGQDGVAVMEPNGNRVIETDALSIALLGKLDLSDNDLIVDYNAGSPLGTIQNLLNRGRHDGAWDGFGITSSAAGANPQSNTTLGALESADYLAVYGTGATFAGRTIDSAAVLVKYTYYGDTDFNGSVDGDDYSRIDQGYNFGSSGWFNGDADGNGAVDGDDYALMDNAFSTQAEVL